MNERTSLCCREIGRLNATLASLQYQLTVIQGYAGGVSGTYNRIMDAASEELQRAWCKLVEARDMMHTLRDSPSTEEVK